MRRRPAPAAWRLAAIVAIGLGGSVGMVAGALLGAPPAACAAPNENATVVEIDMRGLKSVAKETALARVQTRSGMTYKDSVISEDIRRLYSLGYFSDVQVETTPLGDGVKVTFVVVEKPTIGAIELEGDLKMPKDKAMKLLTEKDPKLGGFGLKVGDLYDARKLKDGVDAMKAEYRRKGYYRAEIATSTEPDTKSNAVKIHVVVDAGPRMRIKDILVEGNLAFPDRRIRKLLKTKPRKLFNSGTFEEQVLEEDLERVRVFYRQHGYQDVDADYEVVADDTGRELFVHLKIEEGLQHRVGEVAIEGNKIATDAELKVDLALKPTAVYSTESLQADLRTIKQYYGDRGYINATVTPTTSVDPTTKLVSVTFTIVENELAFVNRIDIQGNLRTKDVVVRRELRIHPGEPFDGKKIRRSIERLYNLGFFEEVGVDTQPVTGKPNHNDLIVDVKEAKTGSFSFGGGFSSVDRVVGLIELEQRNFDWKNFPNFVGGGQDLRFRVEVGTVRRYFDLSWTEPWFMGHPVSFGVDAFNRTRLRSSNLGLAFEEERRGGGLRLGKELTEQLRADLGYQIFNIEISDVAPEASADLRAEAGKNLVSVGGLTFGWDSTDNRFDPTKGANAYAGADLAGGPLMGDKDFYRFQAGASGYVPHFRRSVLELRVRSGVVNEFGDAPAVPIFERFFAGGSNTIRGFRERRVGPRDPLSNDPIGGEAIFIGTLEEVVTLYKDERGKSVLKGSVFYDIGNVWRDVGDFGSDFEAGTGVGLRVNTPIGPVRLDLGFPITQIEDEKRKPRLHFNISRSF